jgi:hypothetical protein
MPWQYCLSTADIGKITAVWIEVDTWVVEKIVLGEEAERGMGQRSKEV